MNSWKILLNKRISRRRRPILGKEFLVNLRKEQWIHSKVTLISFRSYSAESMNTFLNSTRKTQKNGHKYIKIKPNKSCKNSDRNCTVINTIHSMNSSWIFKSSRLSTTHKLTIQEILCKDGTISIRFLRIFIVWQVKQSLKKWIIICFCKNKSYSKKLLCNKKNSRYIPKR